MADDKSKTGKADDIRIDKNDPNELAYWSGKFGISKEALLQAIEKANSPMVEKIRQVIEKTNK